MKWSRITVHHTASKDVSAETIRRWHLAKGYSDIGYHFVIRGSGFLELGRPLTKMGAHVGGQNEENIGICLTGHFDYRPPTQQQYETLKTVLKVLKRVYEIEDRNVFTHKQLTKTRCPGELFDVNHALNTYRPI